MALDYKQYEDWGKQFNRLKLTESFWLDGGTFELDLGSDATGDIYYRNSSGFLTRLPISGTSTDVLGISAGLPAWVTAPSSGGLSSVPLGNSVYVSKDGNDGTGARERVDLPFLTIQAAITAASSGDTVIVHPGTYNEGIILKNGVNIHLMAGVIIDRTTADSTSTMMDNGVAVTCIIDGFGIIRKSASSGYVYHQTHASSNVRIRAKEIAVVTSTSADAIYIQAGTADITADYITSNSYATVRTDSTTTALTLRGTVYAGTNSYGVLCGGGIVNYSGDATSDGNAALHCSLGTFTYFGGYAKSTRLFGFEMSGGVASIRNATLESTRNVAVEGSAISKYGGELLVLDNVRLLATHASAKSIESQGDATHGSIEIITSCFANREIQSSPAMNITFGRYNLLVSSLYIGHAPLDTSDNLVNQSFLGTGSAGAGAKYLADDQTWKTLTQYTDEMAQDAIGLMLSAEFAYTDGTPLLAIASIAATKITEDSTHRFVTDAEKTTWNAKISAANLTLGTATTTTQPINIDTGTDVTLPIFGTNAGLVPGTASGTTNFLRADGTWAAPTASASLTQYYVGTGNASNILGGSSSLQYDANGTFIIGNTTDLSAWTPRLAVTKATAAQSTGFHALQYNYNSATSQTGGENWATRNFHGVSGTGLGGSMSGALFNQLYFAASATYNYTTSQVWSAMRNMVTLQNSNTADRLANTILGTQVYNSSTLTTYYALFIEAPDLSGGGSITNSWGIYQESAAANNFFNGEVRIGSTSDMGAFSLQVTGDAAFSGHIRLAEISAPSTPASGFSAIYTKTDGILYFKNDAGTEYDLTATGGGGSLTVRYDDGSYSQTATTIRFHEDDFTLTEPVDGTTLVRVKEFSFDDTVFEGSTDPDGSPDPIGSATNPMTIKASVLGEVNTTSNAGSTGGRVGLAMTKSGVDFPFKSLVAGTNITLGTSVTGEVLISSTGGGSGSPGGSTTQIQFNNAGAFDGDAKFTWDDTNFRVGIYGGIRYTGDNYTTYIDTYSANGYWKMKSSFGGTAGELALVTFNDDVLIKNMINGDIIFQTNDGEEKMRVKGSSTDVWFKGGIRFEEITAPGTPAAGTVIMYTKADGKIYIKDDAGTETDLTATGGGGISDGDKGHITVASSGTLWTIDDSVVTYAKIQNVTADRLLGRVSSGGVVQEISLGTGLSFDGTALSVSFGNYINKTVTNTYTAGAKQIFVADATNAGFAFGGVTADPSSPQAGDLWYRSDTGLVSYRDASGTRRFISDTALAAWTGNTSITSVGTIGTGTWQGGVISSTYGGTGVNNGARTLTLNTNNFTIVSSNQANTLTLANNLLTAGNFALTLTTTATTNVTLPTTGTLATLAGAETLSNKRWTERASALSANSATPAINTDTTDVVIITAQTANITSMTTNLTGTPTNGQKLWISFTASSGTPTITWGASFEDSLTTAPTSMSTTRIDVGFIWNAATSKWRCVGKS